MRLEGCTEYASRTDLVFVHNVDDETERVLGALLLFLLLLCALLRGGKEATRPLGAGILLQWRSS